MSNKIESSIGAAVAAAAVRPVSRGRDGAAAGTGKSASDDSVQLTGDAQALQNLDGCIRADSGVDTAKVAEIRRQIAEGRYAIDSDAVAKRLVATESTLR